MVFKKYVRKQWRRAKKYAKKRYMPAGKIDFGKVASDVMKLKGIINTERKYKEVNQTGANVGAISTAWTIQRLNELEAQDGDRPGERHGMSVRFKYFQIRGRLWMSSPSTATNPHRCRVIIFVDKQPLVSGLTAFPAVTELLTGNTLTGGYVNSMKAVNELHQKRFTILSDRTYTFDDDYPEKLIKLSKPLNMVTTWASGYVNSDAINRNALYIAFISDTPTAGDLQYEFHSRLSLYDN